MDRLIERFPRAWDGDLIVSLERGVAYQLDMKRRVLYGQDYWNKCLGYEDQDIALKINAGRIALVNKYVGDSQVVDIGIGSGEFIKKRGGNTFGYDINPTAIDWLRQQGLWADDLSAFKAFTFWDVLEHVEHPDDYFRHIGNGGYLFTSLPIFDDLFRIRQSKHYRPGEHLYYWTEKGFVEWMGLYQFKLLERQTFETEAGRESILSFAFKRQLNGAAHD